MVTAYVSIGNSDDKLSQARWAVFFSETSLVLRAAAWAVHGQWVSEPASSWQNACWCIEVNCRLIDLLKENLRLLAKEFEQDSITWAEVPAVEFMGPEV